MDWVFFLLLLLHHALDIANSKTIQKLTSGSVYCNGNDTLQSSSKIFELGLVSLPLGASKSRIYLGIWYTDIKPMTVVWVANRNNPITDGGGSYGLNSEGQLSLKNEAGQVMWTAGHNASLAVLLDTGNLVLQTGDQTHVWESFDHPSNTWLPYMKLGIHTSALTSWVSPEDPSDGPFSNEMLKTTEFISVWRKKQQYSSSGPWNGKGFTNLPQMHQSSFSYNESFTGDAFSWNPYNGSPFITHIIMDSNGIMKHMIWYTDYRWSNLWQFPVEYCNVYSICGSFGICQNTSSSCTCPPGFSPTNPDHWTSQVCHDGCKPNVPLNCNIDEEFTLLNQTSFDLGNYLNTTTTITDPAWALDYSTCMAACKKKCTCTGFYFDGIPKNCTLYFGELFSIRVSSNYV